MEKLEGQMAFVGAEVAAGKEMKTVPQLDFSGEAPGVRDWMWTHGKNWSCPHCATNNFSFRSHCRNCLQQDPTAQNRIQHARSQVSVEKMKNRIEGTRGAGTDRLLVDDPWGEYNEADVKRSQELMEWFKTKPPT